VEIKFKQHAKDKDRVEIWGKNSFVALIHIDDMDDLFGAQEERAHFKGEIDVNGEVTYSGGIKD